MQKIDQLAKDYPDIYEFLISLSDKVELKPIICNCDGDFDGEVMRVTICPHHAAGKLLGDLEKA